ncbi:MAG: metal-dependent hydrolase [Rhizobiales bacterium]|nr:metal-dependent hydrolase [Hyphomicrobiales bacterium]
MFIAHLPAGYILGRTLTNKIQSKYVMSAALIGSVFPDLDMFWFYLVDNRQTHHHDYYTHWPVFYILALFVSVVVLFAHKRAGQALVAFSLGALLNMILDSFTARMHWLRPFSDAYYVPIKTESIYSHWILNFVLHPWFLVEIAICVVAITLIYKIPPKQH